MTMMREIMKMAMLENTIMMIEHVHVLITIAKVIDVDEAHYES